MVRGYRPVVATSARELWTDHGTPSLALSFNGSVGGFGVLLKLPLTRNVPISSSTA